MVRCWSTAPELPLPLLPLLLLVTATRAQLSLARAPLGTASASGEPDGASWAGHASGWAPPQTLAS
jgi:hypothetical protein